MTENAVENPVCSACGAPVRQQAQFCYNCGSSVDALPASAADGKAGEAAEREDLKGESPQREEFVADDGGVKAETPVAVALTAEENHDQPFAKPTTKLLAEDKPENNSPPVMPPPAETKLKSAASLRRGGRVPVQKKTVEVVWDEPESAPNVWFLVAAFVLALFAVGILLAMLYIR